MADAAYEQFRQAFLGDAKYAVADIADKRAFLTDTRVVMGGHDPWKIIKRYIQLHGGQTWTVARRVINPVTGQYEDSIIPADWLACTGYGVLLVVDDNDQHKLTGLATRHGSDQCSVFTFKAATEQDVTRYTYVNNSRSTAFYKRVFPAPVHSKLEMGWPTSGYTSLLPPWDMVADLLRSLWMSDEAPTINHEEPSWHRRVRLFYALYRNGGNGVLPETDAFVPDLDDASVQEQWTRFQVPLPIPLPILNNGANPLFPLICNLLPAGTDENQQFEHGAIIFKMMQHVLTAAIRQCPDTPANVPAAFLAEIKKIDPAMHAFILHPSA